jgi:sulfopyruvate decarboxylase TPP-binding subunit
MAQKSLAGAEIIAALTRAKVEFVAAVPDITTSAGLLWPIARGANFKLVRLCKEDEGVSVCAGLAVAGRRAVLLIQHTGMLDSLNAIRGIACEQAQPICMLVGLLAKEPDVPPSRSKSFGLRIVEPILDALGIEHFCIEGDEDAAQLPAAIDRAYATSRPLAALIGQTVTP